ncbi:MAG: GntR family transcriptional regulator [Planctomycetes bacterium]|nr:GntR family transcriptional regulator [Planctomycetota bacterium]
MTVNRKNKNSPTSSETAAGSLGAAESDGLATLPTLEIDGGNGEQTLVDGVYEQILLRIIQGKLVSGQELKSTVLAQELGVSRTPVVQALQRLAADGIVNLELNKRAVVRTGAENWLVEVHQLRELLEPPAAALAAQLVPDDQLAKLRALAEAAADRNKPGWSAAVRKFDFALHLTIADNTGNLALREAIRKCWSYKRLSYSAVEDQPASLAKAYDEHLAIVRALESRDSQTASAAMLFHLRSAAVMRPERRIV